MNTKLQVFLFVVVLLASMVSVSESFAGGGEVGRKRSYLEQVKLQISKTIHLLTFSNYSGLNFASNLVIIRLTKSRNNYFTIDQDKIWFTLILTIMKREIFYNSIFIYLKKRKCKDLKIAAGNIIRLIYSIFSLDAS